jgi:Dolichyl-phosphate-mannose-protein mannosyltransferase
MSEVKPAALRLDHEKPPPSSRSSIIIFILLLGLFIGVRLWHLTAACLWFDEVFSIHATRYEWGRMLHFVAADAVHPPLFYALLKVWIEIGGESLLWLRLLPSLISIAAVVPFLLLCRELGLRATETRLALPLMAVNGYLIKYAQEVRMYSLLLLLALCSLWLFVKFFRSVDGAKRQLAWLFAVNLLLVYSHYYGWMVVAVEALSLLIKGRGKRLWFFISVLALILCFSPWLYALASAERGQGLAQNIGWVARPRLSDVAQLFTLFNEPFYYRQSSIERPYSRWSLIAGLLLFGWPLLALFRQVWKEGRGAQAERRGDGLRLLLYFTFAPVILAFTLSRLLPQSIWGIRHLIIAAGPYMILAGTALDRLRPVAAKYGVLTLLGCWLFLAGMVTLLLPKERHIWCSWEQLSKQMVEAQAAPPEGVKVYAFEDLVAYHLWFALDESVRERYKVAVIKGVPGLREDTAYFLPRAFDDIAVRDSSALTEEHIWMAFRDTNFDETRPPLKTAMERGYKVGKVLRADAVGQRAFLVELWRK